MPWPEPKFRTTHSRGYDPQEVDALIDRLDEAEQSGRPISPDLVRNAQFTTTHLSGYRMDDVDAWLDQVVMALGQAAEPLASAGPTGPVNTPPEAQVTAQHYPPPYGQIPDAQTPDPQTPDAEIMDQPDAPIARPTSWAAPDVQAQGSVDPTWNVTSDLTAAAMTSESASGDRPRWPVLTGIAVAVVVIILIFYFVF